VNSSRVASFVSNLVKPRPPGRGSRFSRRRVVGEAITGAVFGSGWAARAWGRLPGRTTVDLIEHQLALLPTGPGARTLRLAFASDLHIGPLTSPALLDNAFARLAEARPDVLVLGGDYVYLEATHAMARELEARVAAVPAPTKLAILGNHDLWTHHDRIEDALRRAGTRILINDAAFLPPPFEDIAIIGLDDVWTGQPDPAAAMRAAAGAALTIGIAHSPEAVPLLKDCQLPLLLCGHTHGGQIALPTGPVVVHGKHGRRWPGGLYDVDGTKLFVSRGLGSVELPIRAYARPDVSVFTLTSAG
jgi:predicted MPP superfamily phosphohydrolase